MYFRSWSRGITFVSRIAEERVGTGPRLKPSYGKEANMTGSSAALLWNVIILAVLVGGAGGLFVALVTSIAKWLSTGTPSREPDLGRQIRWSSP